MKFSIICKRCWNAHTAKSRTIVDDCGLFISPVGQVSLYCNECGESEIITDIEDDEEIEETVAYSRDAELLREKKVIEEELKKKLN